MSSMSLSSPGIASLARTTRCNQCAIPRSLMPALFVSQVSQAHYYTSPSMYNWVGQASQSFDLSPF
jgi:hypothetical protein